MKTLVRYAAAIAAIASGLGIVHASGPIAVYALVDKVAFEPNADNPERIQISGVFITAGQGPNAYSAPQRGYLYFMLPAGNRELALREWADLKSIAGTRQVVGFGSGWFARARVRMAEEPATTPDSYAMGNGLVRMNSEQPHAKLLLDYPDR
jgi:hypothetical protein